MTTFTVQIPDKKAELAKQMLKELGAVILPRNTETKKENSSECEMDHIPNVETIQAMEDAKAGKVKKITNLKDFFSRI